MVERDAEVIAHLLHLVERQQGFTADTSVGTVATDVQQFCEFVSEIEGRGELVPYLVEEGRLDGFLLGHGLGHSIYRILR